jgi:hypothetical protein
VSLLPFTRLVLGVSALVQTIFGLADLFAKPVVDALLWPAPLEPWPTLGLQYNGALYLACALGAAYALRQDHWVAARTYFAIAGPYNALSIVLAVLAAASSPGIPPILWVYVVLALIYVPAVAFVWSREAPRWRGAAKPA